MGHPFYDFRPYNYGPFDVKVYQDLEALGKSGLVRIDGYRGQRRYALTPHGRELGRATLNEFPGAAKAYIKAVADWVRSLSFADLVGAIYRAYPQMRERSIFQD